MQSLAISIGVGCSTVAVAYYLTRDDTVHDRMRQQDTRIVYRLMRIGLLLLFVSTAANAIIFYLATGGILLTTYSLVIWFYICILLINALFMFLRRMPAVIGPLLQSATWYALAITVAMPSDAIADMPMLELLAWYVGFAGVVIAAANLLLAHKQGHI